MAKFELPVDRLATTDAEGRRLKLYPSDVRGKFRGQRSRLQALLLAILVVLPWIRVDGRGHRRTALLRAPRHEVHAEDERAEDPTGDVLRHEHTNDRFGQQVLQ